MTNNDDSDNSSIVSFVQNSPSYIEYCKSPDDYDSISSDSLNDTLNDSLSESFKTNKYEDNILKIILNKISILEQKIDKNNIILTNILEKL